MFRSVPALALCLIFLTTPHAFSQGGGSEVPPVDESSFAGKPISQLNADEVLQLVRYS